MRKMPCLFERTFRDRRTFTLHETITPGCEWAAAGEGIATRKWDGTACMVKDGVLYKRYDAKKNPKTGVWKMPPEGAIPCDEPDPVTGHWPHWVKVGDEPESVWHRKALSIYGYDTPAGWLSDGTYELIGPQIGGNAERVTQLSFQRHGGPENTFPHCPRTFEGLRNFLGSLLIEGIVFHHPDGRMCKIRRADFGLPWGTHP